MKKNIMFILAFIFSQYAGAEVLKLKDGKLNDAGHEVTFSGTFCNEVGRCKAGSITLSKQDKIVLKKPSEEITDWVGLIKEFEAGAFFEMDGTGKTTDIILDYPSR